MKLVLLILTLSSFALILTKQSTPAQTRLSTTQKHNPQAQKHRDQGDKLCTAAHYLDAQREYQAAYNLDKANVFLRQDSGIDLRKLGNALVDQAQYTKGDACYQHALTIARKFHDGEDEAHTLFDLGLSARRRDQQGQAVAYYREALARYRQSHDATNIANTLFYLGLAYDALEQYDKASQSYQQALSVYQTLKNTVAVAKTLYRLGHVAYKRGQDDRAIGYYQKALPTFLKPQYFPIQAQILFSMGVSYDDLDHMEQAVSFYLRALAIHKHLQSLPDMAADLTNLGLAYMDLGQFADAVRCHTQALAIHTQNRDVDGQAEDSSDLGYAYRHLAQYAKSIHFFQKALVIHKSLEDWDGQGYDLMGLGIAYNELSQGTAAASYLQRALVAFRRSKDPDGQAKDLKNLGNIYDDLSHYEKAVGYYQMALAIHQQIRDEGGQADDLNNLGVAYDDLGQSEKTVKCYQQALAILKRIHDRDGEALVLNNLGAFYKGRNQEDNALHDFQQALIIYQQVDDRNGTATSLYNLMFLWKKLETPALAVFYGKQAVNTYQSIRQDIATMDKSIQKDYLKDKEPTYRTLAELLIQQERLPEALQVLDMLKQEEYLNFTLNTQERTQELAEQAQFTAPEAAWNTKYQDAFQALDKLAEQSQPLRDKKELTDEEKMQLAAFDAQIASASQKLDQILAQIQTEAKQVDDKQDRLDTQADATKLQQTLGQLGHQSVAVYTLAGDTDLTLMLVTPDKITAYRTPVKAADLQKKIDDFRKALQYPDVDPRPYGQELYDLMVKPMEADLKADGAQTLMWSLDGSLRYIPIAALYDGKQYLVERYTNTLFTPASDTQLTADPQEHWTGLGMGVSKKHPGFDPLENVPAELESVIRDPKIAASQKGALPGTILLDPQFTRTALLNGLSQHDPLVHIASHFAFQPGDAKDSFLLLGDGSHLSLADIQAMPDDLLAGVNLLTLSACETAADGAGANGKEVENLAVLAQRKGADAVMATLWSVNDAATEQLMHDFYDDRQQGAGMSKADALRQAQLSVLNDPSLAKATVGRGPNRAEIVPNTKSQSTGKRYTLDPAHPQVHPYYWAPFILIGNWK